MAPICKTFCGFLTLRDGAIITAFLHVIPAFASLLGIFFVAPYLKQSGLTSTMFLGTFIIWVIEIVAFTISLFLLICGAEKRNEWFLLPYIIWMSAAIPVVFTGTGFYATASIGTNRKYDSFSSFLLIWYPIFLISLTECYLLVIVISYYQKLKADRLERKIAELITKAKASPISKTGAEITAV